MLNKELVLKLCNEIGNNDVIRDKKENAFSKFLEFPMPSPGDEGWKYTNIMDLDLNSVEVSGQEIVFPSINDEDIENGVIFCNIKEALAKHFDILREHFPMSLIKENDKVEAMHSAFWNDGIFIYVPKNTELKVPLRNNFIVNGKGGIFSHTLIIVDDNSTLTYIEEHNSKDGEYKAIRNDAVEIYVGKNSCVNFYNFQNWENNVINMTNWKGHLDRDSRLNWIFGQFGGTFSRIKAETIFAGEGSESKCYGVFYGTDEQKYDFTTDSFHNVPNTTGDILVKGVLDQKATSVYRGMIKILKGAQNTNSYLSDHSLILSKDAVSNSIPSLEIDANEVSASHGATLGKPDEEEIFYLMSRGLNKKEAEKLIILGYFSPIINALSVDDLKEKYNNALSSKVSK